MTRFLPLALLGAAIAGAGPGTAAIDSYLKLDGMEASSQARPGWMQIEGWSWEAGRGGGAGDSGRAVAATSAAHEVSITKPLDTGSPALRQAAATGRHFARATIEAESERYVLHDVVIAEDRLLAGGERPVERITLSFARVVSRSGAAPRRLLSPEARPLPTVQGAGR